MPGYGSAPRVEQVRALGESLLAPYGRPDEAELLAAVEELVLARLRHLAAHEIGHALGFMHNFASTTHPKPSVMDYPHARVRVGEDGRIDLSSAYTTGLGPWDHFLVAHAYGQFADEAAELARLRRESAELAYVSDDDGQGPHVAHADGVPWVTAAHPLQALETMTRVRRIALDGFSRGVLPPERQTGELEERFALLYLLHRHEVAAVARLVGGVRYAYGLAGDGPGASRGTEVVDAVTQQRALVRLASLLRAEHLALPDAVLDALTPPAIRYERTDQYLDTDAGRIFDPIGAVGAAVTLVTEQLLEPARLNRVAWQHATDPAVPGVSDVVDALLATTWHRTDPVPGELRGGVAVQHAVDWTLLNHLLTVARDGTLHATARTELRAALRRLAAEARRRDDDGGREAADLIGRFLSDPGTVHLDPLPRVPPGAPN